jgi:vacuolar protein sorting-associated protein 45
MEEEEELFERNCRGEQNTVLLLLDRREDPVTPLLNQWTYQAMIHELIEIANNRVNIKKGAKVKVSSDADEVVLSVDTDPFYARSLYLGYGELASSLKEMVEQLQARTQEQSKIDTLEDMQRVLDHYPEYKKHSANVYKHVDLLTLLNHTVDERKLLEISRLEQSLAVTDAKDEHFKVHDSSRP